MECGSSCLRCFQCVRLPHPSRVPILIVHLPRPSPVYTFVPPYSNCAPWPPSLSPTQPIIACSLRKQVRRHKLSQNKLFDPLLQDSTNLSKLSFVLLKVSGLLLPTFVERCGGGALSKSLFFGRPQICDIPVCSNCVSLFKLVNTVKLVTLTKKMNQLVKLRKLGVLESLLICRSEKGDRCDNSWNCSRVTAVTLHGRADE